MPPVRRAILSWDPRKTEEIIVFVSLWKSQLHQNIWDNVSNELILNKLEFQGNGRKVPDLRKIYMFLTFEKSPGVEPFYGSSTTRCVAPTLDPDSGRSKTC